MSKLIRKTRLDLSVEYSNFVIDSITIEPSRSLTHGKSKSLFIRGYEPAVRALSEYLFNCTPSSMITDGSVSRDREDAVCEINLHEDSNLVWDLSKDNTIMVLSEKYEVI